jgi:predicted nucleic acid-binding protein
VEVVDADKAHLVAALERSRARSARRISDAILAATAEHAGCDWIATFDEAFSSPSVPSRLI